MLRNFVILLAVLSVITRYSYAQPVKSFSAVKQPLEAGLSAERLQRIDRMVEDHVSKGQIPGAVVMIVRDGKIAYHKAFGFRDQAKNIALQKDDIFRIASQSKAITSLAVMMLWEEGKFLLDDPVSRYIPEFREMGVLKTFTKTDTTYTTDPAKGEITIRQLLTHTSGLDYPAIGSEEFKAIYAKHRIPSGIGNDSDVLGNRMKVLGGLPLKHHPGERWTYGINTDLLGYLVEIWSGQTFDQFLRSRIFDPLGMKDTYFYLPSEKHNRLVTLYETRNGKISAIQSKAYDNADPQYPTLKGTYYSGGAGLSSTTEDYARFLQLFLNKGEFNGVRLLSRKTVELMLTDQIADTANEFGLGFGLETAANDHRSPLSLGSFSWGGAFNTHYWADPKERLIGLIYTNMYNSPYWSVGEKFKALTYQAIAD